MHRVVIICVILRLLFFLYSFSLQFTSLWAVPEQIFKVGRITSVCVEYTVQFTGNIYVGLFDRLFHQFTGIYTVCLGFCCCCSSGFLFDFCDSQKLIAVSSMLFQFVFLSNFSEKSGVRAGDLFMSFKSIFQDVRSAMDHVHLNGDLQNETVAVSARCVCVCSLFTFRLT